MSKLVWDQEGQKQYELGVSKGVIYKYNSTSKKWIGEAWNGLTSVSESPDGGDENELWADNIKYGSLRGTEKFGGSIEAYTYPDSFEGCDGMGVPRAGMTLGQQKREKFCLSYRTEIGNDLDPEAGYRLHLVYMASCSPSERSYETVNDSPDAITFSWDFDTVPVNVTKVEGYKPTSHIVFDSTKFTTSADKELLKALEDKLYGTDAGDGVSASDPEMPMPDEVLVLMGLAE